MVLLLAGQPLADPDLPLLLTHPSLLASCQSFLGHAGASPAPVPASQKGIHVLQGEAAVVDLHVVRPPAQHSFLRPSAPPDPV